MSGAYEIKTEVIGPHQGYQKEMKVLGRIISWRPWGLQYEPDPGHAELVIQELGLVLANFVASPWAYKETRRDDGGAEAPEARRINPGHAAYQP